MQAQRDTTTLVSSQSPSPRQEPAMAETKIMDSLPQIPPAAQPAVFTPPEYTMKEIHDAIPPHCFERSSLRSLSYVFRDCALAATLALVAATQIPSIRNTYIRVLAWAFYAFCQGLVFTGLWELAHESGHGALSKHKWVNNAIGMVIHSSLLVPYHSWRITHSQHHKATNNLDRDIAFVPTIKEDYLAERENHNKTWEMIEDMPIVALIHLFFHQLIAFPLYLTINNLALERMRAAKWYSRSHFYFGGDGPNFKPSNRNDIIISDVGIAIAFAVLWQCVVCYGGWTVTLLYVMPYLWTNHWILTITFLQHNDLSLPYYPSSTWSFLRGAASTVDRDFGIIGRHIFHGAIETHVLHHHACRIPFYHAAEASEAIKSVMGTHYKKDPQRPSLYLWSFWKNYRACRVVVGDENGVYFFEKKA